MSFIALSSGIGRLEPDGSVAVLDSGGETLANYLQRGEKLHAISRDVIDRIPFASASLATFVASGASVFGIGLNYRSKQIATGRALPDQPILFAKSPASYAVAGEPITLPELAPSCVDYEGEIAVIIGKTLYNATPSTATDAVCGYAAANDVSARDVMKATGNPMLAKSFPGFGQFASVVIDRADVGNITDIGITTTVNGEVRQKDSGAGLIIGVGELLSLLSQHIVLRPGDVVLTGTPAGTGDETKRYLASGDVVEIALSDQPPLRTAVVASQQTSTNC